MTSKERFLAALNREKPDRLPVTTHHLMPSFLNNYLDGISDLDFFDRFGLDPVQWIMAYKPDLSRGDFHDHVHTELRFLEARRVASENWIFQIDDIENPKVVTQRFSIITPEKTLSMILQSNQHTTWVAEHLIKEKTDIDIIAKYMTMPLCDVEAVNKAVDSLGDKGMIRGHICCFDGYGQPGCWQDFACLFGIQNLIMAAFDDPEWVHTFLKVLQKRKKTYIDSMAGARYDLLELGGGDASTTVISPDFFHRFVAPYDSVLIEAAHAAGQRIVYHTCGGMMPILEYIAAMGPDAMETFTPTAIGGDTDLAEAKQRIGEKACMIGGFDQFNFFTGCTPADTRKEVRRCFEAAGGNGGYILSPSDHFFEADLELITAFADEAQHCTY